MKKLLVVTAVLASSIVSASDVGFGGGFGMNPSRLEIPDNLTRPGHQDGKIIIKIGDICIGYCPKGGDKEKSELRALAFRINGNRVRVDKDPIVSPFNPGIDPRVTSSSEERENESIKKLNKEIKKIVKKVKDVLGLRVANPELQPESTIEESFSFSHNKKNLNVSLLKDKIVFNENAKLLFTENVQDYCVENEEEGLSIEYSCLTDLLVE